MRRSSASWTSGSRSWPSSSRPSIASWSTAAKRRAGEYLLAAQQALDQPTTEDFMLIADGTDLNPAMLVRWQSYLSRTRKAHDPVFAPWHALAALPPGEFAARSARLIAACAKVAGRPHRSTRSSRGPWRKDRPGRWPTWRGSTAGC